MIESLQSTHVARVKALLSSKKERYESGEFVAEGLQPVREAIAAHAIETIYLTTNGAERLADNSVNTSNLKVFEISDAVAKAMSDTETPQGP